jgi:hypothetical protein
VKIRIEDITADAKQVAFAEPEQEINRILGEGPIREYHLEGPVEVSVSFYRAGTELFFSGMLKTRTGAVCARCAEDFDALVPELAEVEKITGARQDPRRQERRQRRRG